MDSWPLVLLAPSQAAAWELPRRLAASGRALAGVYPFKLQDLARALAEPALLGQGLRAWDSGHAALLAARLLDGPHGLPVPEGLPRAPLARALAQTLVALRRAGIAPERLLALAAEGDRAREDVERLRALAGLLRGFLEAVQGRFADAPTVLRAAAGHAGQAKWLEGARVLVMDELELGPAEREFLASLARTMPVERLARHLPPGLKRGSFGTWAESLSLPARALAQTAFAPLAPPSPPAGLRRLREQLFEAPGGGPVEDGSVELVTAPGEAAEAGAIARRLLREAARGVPFEEMGVILPRPDVYAPLFTDLLRRLRIPCRLHPSLPLATGRSARSLLLLFRCRRLARPAVMEFLTFAPMPWGEILGDSALARPEQWDQLSRDAQIVSDLERWTSGLQAHAEAEREAAAVETQAPRRARRQERAQDASTLLGVVRRLAATLETLSGEASWTEWSERLRIVFDQWIGPGHDREAVADVLADLGGLSSVSDRAKWSEVEEVLEARFEWERMPLDPITTGAVHVGVLDALAGLPFRVVAVVGLVEGGYPGVLRPDPFLLDPEREALETEPAGATLAAARPRVDRRSPALAPRRHGRRAHGPRARPCRHSSPPRRTACSRPVGRSTARSARPRRSSSSAIPAPTRARVASDCPHSSSSPRLRRSWASRRAPPTSSAWWWRTILPWRPLALALDPSERDRKRVLEGGEEAAQAVAGGSAFFRQSRIVSRARWAARFSEYDGFLGEMPAELKARLDPLRGEATTSASRLATFARCGFQYLLQHVLRLEPALEPEERRRLDPLERGSLFHEVAELYLRERRDRGELPVRDTPPMQERLLVMADDALERFVAGSPPRFTLLWEREKRLFRSSVLVWLAREAAMAERSTPAFFEMGFGMPVPEGSGEPHSAEPLIDRSRGRPAAPGDRQDRPDRPKARRQPAAPRLQDGQGATRRRGHLPRRQAAPDPVLRAGRPAALPRRRR